MVPADPLLNPWSGHVTISSLSSSGDVCCTWAFVAWCHLCLLFCPHRLSCQGAGGHGDCPLQTEWERKERAGRGGTVWLRYRIGSSVWSKEALTNCWDLVIMVIDSCVKLVYSQEWAYTQNGKVLAWQSILEVMNALRDLFLSKST